MRGVEGCVCEGGANVCVDARPMTEHLEAEGQCLVSLSTALQFIF